MALAALMLMDAMTSPIGAPPPPVPSLGTLSVAQTTGGACNTTTHTITSHGTYTLSWTVSNADDTNYTCKIYANSVYLATVNSTFLTYLLTMPGVLNDSGHQQTLNINYYLQITRNSDSQVISTSNTVNYTALSGDCSGAA